MAYKSGFSNIEYFKNFNMGRELEIAGEFIYESAIKMKALSFVGNHFNVNTILYNGAVGIERLQKILLCMNMVSESELETPLKCLKEHNHIILQNKIKEIFGITFNKNQIALLELFRRYYDDFRYAEYQIDYNETELCNMLIDFINKRTGTSISIGAPFLEQDYRKMKSYFINLLGQISYKYYNEIWEKANGLGLFTCEMSSDSNAAKIFYRREEEKLYDILQIEEYAFKEFLIYLLSAKKKTKFLKFFKSLAVLDFDEYMIPEYLLDITNFKSSVLLNDFVEDAYTNFSRQELKERKEILDLMSNSQVMWED
ncbi:MAG: hypothetical protein NC184_02680 [Roseburia sp.]|nr:hypothetical protein [Roseburia sp.]